MLDPLAPLALLALLAFVGVVTNLLLAAVIAVALALERRELRR